jgi:hypothetical protein
MNQLELPLGRLGQLQSVVKDTIGGGSAVEGHQYSLITHGFFLKSKAGKVA